MTIVIFGGAGFVGLNIVEALLDAGRHVVLVDRAAPPPAVIEAFAAKPGRLETLVADVTDPTSWRPIIKPGVDAIVFGAAITAGPAREAAEPERILAVNLAALVPVLRAARAAGVRRVVNLSSATAYGATGARATELDEAMASDPAALYPITKFASERVAARLAELWRMDVASARLSAVFGPWEWASGVRDTISPPGQIMIAARAGRPALLARPGLRDWLYAPDAAEAIGRLIAAPSLAHALYNVTGAAPWPALAFGQLLAGLQPGFVCRLAEPGEAANIDLHAATDRAPLSPRRLAADLGWRAAFDPASAASHFHAWSAHWPGYMEG